MHPYQYQTLSSMIIKKLSYKSAHDYDRVKKIPNRISLVYRLNFFFVAYTNIISSSYLFIHFDKLGLMKSLAL